MWVGIKNPIFGGYIYTSDIDLVRDSYKRYLEILVRVYADKPRVCNSDASCTWFDGITAGWVVVKDSGVRKQDFWGFLPNSESISQLIL